MDGTQKSDKYYYSTYIAKTIGLEAAVIFEYICIYVDYAKKSKSIGKYHDGKYWTYASRQDISQKIPYISESKIYRALSDLIKAGYIIKSNYNKIKYDRTLWYTVTDAGWSIYNGEYPQSNEPSEQSNVSDAKSIATEQQPIVHNKQCNNDDGKSIVANAQPIPMDISIMQTMHKTMNTSNTSLVADFLRRRYKS